MSEKKQYRLYAMFISHDALVFASKERFCRVTASYALVYTDKVVEGKGIREITDADAYRLSEVEREWLSDCNKILITESTIENEAEFIKEVSERLDKVEAALKEEQRKIDEV